MKKRTSEDMLTFFSALHRFLAENRIPKDVLTFLFCSSTQCGPRLIKFSNVALRVKGLPTLALASIILFTRKFFIG